MTAAEVARRILNPGYTPEEPETADELRTRERNIERSIDALYHELAAIRLLIANR